MYERMLDKQASPSFDDLLSYSGASAELWTDLDEYLRGEFSASRTIRFPYGKKYGWSAKYSVKSKHICDAFAENGAFAAHFRIANGAVMAIYGELADHAKSVCDNGYPCGEGCWLTFRVLDSGQLKDLKRIISAKIGAVGK